jgi:DNA-directed RNA polymerase sigma subunit (sigma70/sigma32)
MVVMETRKKSSAAVVTEGAAQAALRRGPTRELTPEEERVMRMRLGAAPPRAAPLERAAEELTDLEIELRSYEIEAYMKWRAREQTAAPAGRAIAPAPSRAKEKIIRALRKMS